jgi:hypothetical protein
MRHGGSAGTYTSFSWGIFLYPNSKRSDLTTDVAFAVIFNFIKVVSFEEGKQLASEFGIQFFETSAKNDMNVETVQITPQIPPSICRCNLLILETPLMHLRCDCPGIHNCSQGGEKPFST